MLERFLIHASRAKACRKASTFSKTINTNQEKMVDTFEWASEEMDLRMGPLKGASWRDSKLLPTAPCPLTGSREPHLLIYKVPVGWNRMTESDLKQWKLNFEADATGQECELMENNRVGRAWRQWFPGEARGGRGDVGS